MYLIKLGAQFLMVNSGDREGVPAQHFRQSSDKVPVFSERTGDRQRLLQYLTVGMQRVITNYNEGS